MTLSPVLQNCHTLDQVVSLINDGGTSAHSGDEIAGQYIFDAADTAGYGVTFANLNAHAEALEEAGAVINDWAAVYKEADKQQGEHAKQAAPFFKIANTNCPNGDGSVKIYVDGVVVVDYRARKRNLLGYIRKHPNGIQGHKFRAACRDAGIPTDFVNEQIGI